MDIKEFYFQNIQELEYHYRFYDSIKNRVRVHFHKVAAHTGDTYNEMADALAKQGAGI